MPTLDQLGYIYQSPSGSDPSGVYPLTASCSGSTVSVTVASALPILPGQFFSGGTVAYPTYILWQISGIPGGIGVYQLSNLVGIMASGTFYNSMGEPTSQFGQGNIWYQTDTSLYLIRNYNNTAWIPMGYGDQIGLGMLASSGGAMNGLITGSSLVTADGLTPIAVPPESLAQNSPIASLADLQALETYFLTVIKNTVNNSLSNIPTSGLNANMVFHIGITGPAATYNTIINLNTLIPTLGLTYADGTIVQASDCYGFASISYVTNMSGSLALNFTLTQNDTKGMQWTAYYTTANSPYNLPSPINYLIIAFKPGA